MAHAFTSGVRLTTLRVMANSESGLSSDLYTYVLLFSSAMRTGRSIRAMLICFIVSSLSAFSSSCSTMLFRIYRYCMAVSSSISSAAVMMMPNFMRLPGSNIPLFVGLNRVQLMAVGCWR